MNEASVTSKAQVLAATGDIRASRKAQREAERLKSWEEHCAWEKERFEKAARWMETHFDAVGKAVASGDEAAKAKEAPVRSRRMTPCRAPSMIRRPAHDRGEPARESRGAGAELAPPRSAQGLLTPPSGRTAGLPDRPVRSVRPGDLRSPAWRGRETSPQQLLPRFASVSTDAPSDRYALW